MRRFRRRSFRRGRFARKYSKRRIPRKIKRSLDRFKVANLNKSVGLDDFWIRSNTGEQECADMAVFGDAPTINTTLASQHGSSGMQKSLILGYEYDGMVSNPGTFNAEVEVVLFKCMKSTKYGPQDTWKNILNAMFGLNGSLKAKEWGATHKDVANIMYKIWKPTKRYKFLLAGGKSRKLRFHMPVMRTLNKFEVDGSLNDTDHPYQRGLSYIVHVTIKGQGAFTSTSENAIGAGEVSAIFGHRLVFKHKWISDSTFTLAQTEDVGSSATLYAYHDGAWKTDNSYSTT